MARTFSINLQGKVRNFPLPTSQPLVPLYEAVVNSINAIEERTLKYGPFQGKIEIEVVRNEALSEELGPATVRGFRIADNGIGFDDANMASFMEADSEHKLAQGGKGVGRFSWLKAFSSVHVMSSFRENDGFATREFDFLLRQDAVHDAVKSASAQDFLTVIELNDYREEYARAVPKTLETLAIRIVQHCLVYFLGECCPEIEIFDEADRMSLNQIFKERFLTDNSTNSILVGNREFCLLHIKIADKSFPHRNQLYLCANGRLVERRELEKSVVNLNSEIFERKGYWYLGVLTGNYFDENVDMNRLSFSIPKEGSRMFSDAPGLNEILAGATAAVQNYLDDYLQAVETRKKERIQRYATEVAPQYRHLLHYVPEKIAAIKPDLSDKELDDALHVIKREFENDTKAECDNLMKNLEKGKISSEEYQKQFQKTVGKVSDVNRSALADYVVHRRIILNLFKYGLKIREDGKFNREKYMHQIVYPTRSTSEDLPYENHNLWLLDEKLSFCQYISSDKPFDNAQDEDRTDILVLDRPVVVAESENTGVAFDAITIFELKRPMRDDYDMENNPITQLLDYARKIKEEKAKDAHHRPIRVTATTKFYLYAVCDITSSLKRVLSSLDYTLTPDGLGAYRYNQELHAYVEVLSYDKIKNDSEKRNRVLFDKLGIRD